MACLALATILVSSPFAIKGIGAGGGKGRISPNVIEGFEANSPEEGVSGAVISGGGRPAFPNRVMGDFGSVGGGDGNIAGDRAVVAGGSNNTAIGFRAIVGGGSNNSARFEHATVAGGTGNIAGATRTTVSGGCSNTAGGIDATVSGGSGNIAGDTHATVSGGTKNKANNLDTTIGGGSGNTASGSYATVSGGSNNTAGGFGATVSGGSGNSVKGSNGTTGGGLGNRVSSNYSTVAGGLGNIAGTSDGDRSDSRYAAVGGGRDNIADGFGSSVGGGAQNHAGGVFSMVPGGFSNFALGDYAFAAGRRATVDATHKGVFLFADSNDFDFASTKADEFAARATGGVRLITAIDADGNPIAGVQLTPGSSSWAFLCDRDSRTNFAPVDGRKILDRLVTLPVGWWNYKGGDRSIQHIGPSAQDFYAAFNIGENDRSINMMDIEGVALAAIQGLYQTLREKEAQITSLHRKIDLLKTENTVQRQQIAGLESRFTTLEATVYANSSERHRDGQILNCKSN